MGGDTRVALKHAAGLQPSRTHKWVSDFIVLKAKLPVGSSVFAQEIARLTQSWNDLSGESQPAAIYNFLLGPGYRGAGML